MAEDHNCAKKLLLLTARRQRYDDNILDTQLKRCLKTAEMSFFGIANMIGAGIFVLTGTLLQIAGPAGILSYVLAGISGILAGFCYAEVATLLPKAGSCYTYTYYSIGELYAFIIGWTMISDCIVGFAAVTKAFSAALDVLVGNRISNGTMTLLGKIDSPALAQYPDFVAFGLIVIIVAIIASGAKDSLIVNATCTSILLALLAIIIVCTYVYGGHTEYWSTSENNAGFMPYGVQGVLQGASICVFAFSGFDTIANTSEEAQKPQYSIPRAMTIALVIVMVVYCSACAGLSLMVTANTVDLNAPFAYAFLSLNQTWLYYLSGVATMISTSDVSGMYVLPRMMYALASDGLLFPLFAYVTKKTKVPIWSLLIGGGITALMALLIELSSLAEMTAVGLLLSYATVGVNCLIIRYNGMGNEIRFQLPSRSKDKATNSNSNSNSNSDSDRTLNCIPSVAQSLDIASSPTTEESEQRILKNYPRFRPRFKRVAALLMKFGFSERIVCNWTIWIFVAGCVMLALTVTFGLATNVVGVYWFVAVFLIPVSTVAIVVPLLILYTFSPARREGTFELPLMPLIPCITVLVNVFLIMTIQDITWLRFAVWTVLGLIIYFAYGIRNSNAGRRANPQAESTLHPSTLELFERRPNFDYSTVA